MLASLHENNSLKYIVMYVTAVPNRSSPPTILVRESYREGGEVKNRTLANLSKLPPEAVDAVRLSLRGEKLVPVEEVFEIVQNGSRPHGHVAAVLAAMRRLRFAELIASRRSRERDLVVAMVAARILQPQSKLATTRWWHSTSLAEELGVGDASEEDLYQAMDWLLERQSAVEKKLAARHLEEDGLALYDLTSSYFEGVTCPLAALGHNRDGKQGKLQVNYGLLTNRGGVPVSVSVFKGNTADPRTLLPQVLKVRDDFGIERFVMVGDRGMIMEKQIDALRELEGVEWITALNALTLRKLATAGLLQMGLFDDRDLFEVSAHPDFEGERLIACRNPQLAERRAKKRESLLQATADALKKVQGMVERGRLRDPGAIGAQLEGALSSKLRPYVSLDVREDGFEVSIDEEGLVAAWTRATRADLERLQRRVGGGQLKGRQAIGERVRAVLGRRKVGRHMEARVADDGFEVSIDSRAVLAEATAPFQRKLESVRRRVERGALYGEAAIGVRVGKVINTYKVAKHFILDIRDDGFDFRVDQDKVAAEAALDGVYVIRTSLPRDRMDSEETVRSYKLLSEVERAIRSFKTIDLHVRPIHHNAERRVRSHIFLCMLAYYVQRHMMDAWRPLLFADEDQDAKAVRDPVAPAERSERALEKVRTKRLPDGTPAHSFRTLLQALSNLVRNTCRRRSAPVDEATFQMDTPPDAELQRAYDLLNTIKL
jgi:transposase